jgi:hypothetical protein
LYVLTANIEPTTLTESVNDRHDPRVDPVVAEVGGVGRDRLSDRRRRTGIRHVDVHAFGAKEALPVGDVGEPVTGRRGPGHVVDLGERSVLGDAGDRAQGHEHGGEERDELHKQILL